MEYRTIGSTAKYVKAPYFAFEFVISYMPAASLPSRHSSNPKTESWVSVSPMVSRPAELDLVLVH
jgi:hypothetical protein